jgi:signal transduction histidine kinase
MSRYETPLLLGAPMTPIEQTPVFSAEISRDSGRCTDDFLAVLAHELRNPLAPIRYALQVLKQPGVGGPTVERLHEMMERQVAHLSRMVDDLMLVSRLTEGRIVLRKEVVNAAALLGRAAEAMQPRFEERRQILAVCAPAELRLGADPTRLEQVLVNLLHNASKYTDPGGRIWLSAEREGDAAVFRVKDAGIGIAAAMLPFIFDPLVQGERRLDRSRGGVGIGLTLVRKLVELHGGTVNAYSAGADRGAEFVIRLPRLVSDSVP